MEVRLKKKAHELQNREASRGIREEKNCNVGSTERMASKKKKRKKVVRRNETNSERERTGTPCMRVSVCVCVYYKIGKRSEKRTRYEGRGLNRGSERESYGNRIG